MGGTHRIEVSREQVMAYRVAVHGFERSVSDPDVLAMGVQDTPSGSARQALAARRSSLVGLERVWSFRGAPHLHRRTELPVLAAALWPVDDADATARISTTLIKEGAQLGVRAFQVTAEALRSVVTGPMSKGEVSTAVSAAVPESLTHWCAPCGARHISGLLFQQAGIFAGVAVGAEAGRTVLSPVGERFPVPTAAAETSAVIRAYLSFLGPATPADVAKYLGTKPAVVKAVWPDDVTEVGVDGKKAWLPTSAVEALLSAKSAGLVRLLPPGDPFLQARDRGLVVPVKSREREIWRAIGGPGALLVGSEILGTWRARAAGRRLDLTVTPFAALPSGVGAGLDAEAAVVASARGAADVLLRISQ
ncbi:crosslink repair DNA glycosylase YcaQ family protein [Streptomyces sp. 21So2-11]|uniref:DNA glycosylase AlkZ-like family protein n=1 Tax=Streptomyces sp. 21So2-11 TaxID=3144408 RepID=UPI00321925B1